MYALDTELEIVATLSSSDACLAYRSNGLRGRHFADQRCRSVFEWCMDYFAKHGKFRDAPSVELICDRFPEYPELIAGSKGAAPSYLLERLKAEYVKREVQGILSETVGEIPERPVEATIKLRNALNDTIDATSSSSSKIVYGEDMEAYELMMDEEDDVVGAPYPFPEMQRWTGGIKPGEISVLVGRTGLGKSMFAAKTALEAIRQGWNVYYATWELEPKVIMARIEYMVANEDEFRVPICEYSKGTRLPQYKDAIKAARRKILAMPGKLVVAQPQMDEGTPSALIQNCKVNECNFLIVDQLQFVEKPKRDSQSESVGAAMQEFKQLLMTPADGVKLPMLLLHQMNREGVKATLEKTGKIGNMTNIAHSAWIEQLADVVWGIGRNKEEENVGVMNLGTLKTRSYGSVGWRLNWDARLRFDFSIQHNTDGEAITLEDW